MTLPRGARHSGGVIMLASCAAIMVTYYFTRSDVIGVTSSGRHWWPMTGTATSAGRHFLLSAIILGAIPGILAHRVTRLSFVQLGLGVGDWRTGLRILAVGLPVAVLVGAVTAATPVMRSVYPLDANLTHDRLIIYSLQQLLFFAGWEALFRGVLLFGLRRELGQHNAVVVQTVLSTTAHFGRALAETAAAVPAGIIFGVVTLRLGSIWYVTLIHWMVGVSKDWFLMLN